MFKLSIMVEKRAKENEATQDEFEVVEDLEEKI